jgi:hypothetical protein
MGRTAQEVDQARLFTNSWIAIIFAAMFFTSSGVQQRNRWIELLAEPHVGLTVCIP